MLGIAKIFLVLSACSLYVQGCDQTALAQCVSNAPDNSDNCDATAAATFATCLDNAGYAACDALSAAHARFYLQACASTNCGGSCITNVINSMMEFGSMTPSTSLLICMCENESGDDNRFVKELNDCLAASGYNECSAMLKAALDEQTAPLIAQINSTIATPEMCGPLQATVTGNCDCGKRSDECIAKHMGSDFPSNRSKLLPDEDQDFPEYPECLKFGTEEQFKATFDCLENLPTECGYKDFDIASFISAQAASNNDTDPGANPFPGVKIPFAYEIVFMAHICVKGCENPNATGLKALSCMTNEGIDPTLPADEIKALKGQEKDDFCAKVTKASKCAGKVFSVCPIVALTTANLIDAARKGKEMPSDSSAPLNLTMFVTCDIDFMQYIDLPGDDTSGSVEFNRQPLIALLMALMASVLRWFL